MSGAKIVGRLSGIIGKRALSPAPLLNINLAVAYVDDNLLSQMMPQQVLPLYVYGVRHPIPE